MIEGVGLFLAGLIGGVVNAIAGGGSFITFPALMAAGVSPIAANATNTFASSAGYLSGAAGFRSELWGASTPVTENCGLGAFGRWPRRVAVAPDPREYFQPCDSLVDAVGHRAVGVGRSFAGGFTAPL